MQKNIVILDEMTMRKMIQFDIMNPLKKRLYPTEKTILAVERIKEIHSSFYNTLCIGISTQDIHLTEQTLEQMVENVNQKVWHRMEE